MARHSKALGFQKKKKKDIAKRSINVGGGYLGVMRAHYRSLSGRSVHVKKSEVVSILGLLWSLPMGEEDSKILGVPALADEIFDWYKRSLSCSQRPK